MDIKTFIIVSFFLLSFPLQFFGQKEKFMEGILLDSETKEPVVFATIRLNDKSYGVISNLDGGFKIPIGFQNPEEFLKISSMGYRTKLVETLGLKTDSVNTILLETEAELLDEVVVTSEKKDA